MENLENENVVKMDGTELEGVSGGASQNQWYWGVIIGPYWSNTYGTGNPNNKLLGKNVLVEIVWNAQGPLKLRLWSNNVAVGWTVPASIQRL